MRATTKFLSGMYAVTGVLHFAVPRVYDDIIPVPLGRWDRELTYLSGVAELACAGRPSVLVPLPHAIDDHQSRNAEYLAKEGAAVLLPQHATDAAKLAAQLTEGNAKYALSVSETPFDTKKTERRIDVNLSNQSVTLYENGQVYRNWAMSSALASGAKRIRPNVPAVD